MFQIKLTRNTSLYVSGTGKSWEILRFRMVALGNWPRRDFRLVNMKKNRASAGKHWHSRELQLCRYSKDNVTFSVTFVSTTSFLREKIGWRRKRPLLSAPQCTFIVPIYSKSNAHDGQSFLAAIGGWIRRKNCHSSATPGNAPRFHSISTRTL